MSDKKSPDSSDTFYLAAEDDESLRRELRLTRRSDPNATTQVPCPWCEGHGMVTVEKRAEWLASHAELHKESGDVA